jgi:hypothetical protein
MTELPQPVVWVDYTLDDIIITQEFDGSSNHRLKINPDKNNTTLDHESTWASYGGFATLQYQGRVYYGCSDYYQETFPHVFRLTKGYLKPTPPKPDPEDRNNDKHVVMQGD